MQNTKVISNLLSKLDESLKSSQTTTPCSSILDQISEQKSFSDEQAKQLLDSLPPAIEQVLKEPEPKLEMISRWLNRFSVLLRQLGQVDPKLPTLYWIPLRQKLQEHQLHSLTIELYEQGVAANLDRDGQLSELALLTNICQQPNCPLLVLEKLTTLIFELCQRHTDWLIENFETVTNKRILLKKAPIDKVSTEQPIPWSQIVYRCSSHWQYQQSLAWIKLLQKLWQDCHTKKWLPQATALSGLLQDFWRRCFHLASSLQQQTNCEPLHQNNLILQLGILWTDLMTLPVETMNAKDLWRYHQQSLRHWRALLQLQLDWPVNFEAKDSDSKEHSLISQTFSQIKQQCDQFKLQWHKYLRKLTQAKDKEKLAVLLENRQSILRLINNLGTSKPIWAKTLKVAVLESDDTQTLIAQSDMKESEIKYNELPPLGKISTSDSMLIKIQKLFELALALLGPAPTPLQFCLAGSIVTGLDGSASDIDLEVLIQHDCAAIRRYIDHFYQLINYLILPLNRSIDKHPSHTPWQLALHTWSELAAPDKKTTPVALLDKNETHARWHLRELCATPGGESLLHRYEQYCQQLWGADDKHKESKEEIYTAPSAQSGSSPGRLTQKLKLTKNTLYFKKIESDSFYNKLAEHMFQLSDAAALNNEFSQLIKNLTLYPETEADKLLENVIFELLMNKQLLSQDDQKLDQELKTLRTAQKEYSKYDFKLSEIETAFDRDSSNGLDNLITAKEAKKKFKLPDNPRVDLVNAMHDACQSKKKFDAQLQADRIIWRRRLLEWQYPPSKNRFEKILKVFLQLTAKQQDLSVRFWQFNDKKNQLVLNHQEGSTENKSIDILLNQNNPLWVDAKPLLQEQPSNDKKQETYTAMVPKRQWEYYWGQPKANPKPISTERYLAMNYLHGCSCVMMLNQLPLSGIDRNIIYLIASVEEDEKTERFTVYWDEKGTPVTHALQEETTIRELKNFFQLGKIIPKRSPDFDKITSLCGYTHLPHIWTQQINKRIQSVDQRIDITKVDLKNDYLGPLTRLVNMMTLLARCNLTTEEPYPTSTSAQLEFLKSWRFLTEPLTDLLQATLQRLKTIRERVHQLWLKQPFHPLLTPENRDTAFPPGCLPNDYPEEASLSQQEWQWLRYTDSLLLKTLNEYLLEGWQTLSLPKDWDMIALSLQNHSDDLILINALAYCSLYLSIKPTYLGHYSHVMSEQQHEHFINALKKISFSEQKPEYYQTVMAVVSSYPRGVNRLRPDKNLHDQEEQWQTSLLEITLAPDDSKATKMPQLYWYNPVTKKTVYRALRPSDAKLLFTDHPTMPILDQKLRQQDDKDSESTSLGGMRVVIPLNNSDHRHKTVAYLKCFPQWALRQRFSAYMDYQFTGDYLPHTQVHMIHPESKRHYPVLISQARGPALKNRLPSLSSLTALPQLTSEMKTQVDAYPLPQKLKELELHHFALGVFMNIWLGWGDGSPANVSLDEIHWIRRLFGHDSDCLFTEEWEQKTEWIFWQQKRHGLKSIYFCMPQMLSPIPNTAIDVFCRLSAFNLLEKALQIIVDEEAHYQITGYTIRAIVEQPISSDSQQRVCAGEEVLIINNNSVISIGFRDEKTEIYRQEQIDSKQDQTLIHLLMPTFKEKKGNQRLITDPRVRREIESWLRNHTGFVPPSPLLQQPTSDLQWSRTQLLQLSKAQFPEQKAEDACCLLMLFPKKKLARLFKHLSDMQAWLRDQQFNARSQRKNNPRSIDFLLQYTNNDFGTQVMYLLVHQKQLAPHQRFACLNHPDFIKKMEEQIKAGHDMSHFGSLPTVTETIRTSQIFSLAKDVGQSSSMVMTQASSEQYLQSYCLGEKHQEWQDELNKISTTYSEQYALQITDRLFAGKEKSLKNLLDGQLQPNTVEKVLDNIGKQSHRLPDSVQQSLIPSLRNYHYPFAQLNISNWSRLQTDDLKAIVNYSASRLTRLRLVNCDQLDDRITEMLMSIYFPNLNFLELNTLANIHKIGDFNQAFNLPALRQLKLQGNRNLVSIHIRSQALTHLTITNSHLLKIIVLAIPHLIQLSLRQLAILEYWVFEEMAGWDSPLTLAAKQLSAMASALSKKREEKYEEKESKI